MKNLHHMKTKGSSLSLKMAKLPLNRLTNRLLQVIGIDTPTSCIKWKSLWRISHSQRILLFGWKWLKNAIQVRAYINSKINSVGPWCRICGRVEESINHALLQCEHARTCWFGSHLSLLTHDYHSIVLMDRTGGNSYANMHDQLTPLLNSDHAKMWILTSWWSIWKTRNYLLKVNPLNPNNIRCSIKRMIDEIISSYKGKSTRMKYYNHVDRGILEEDMIYFSNAAFRAADRKAS